MKIDFNQGLVNLDGSPLNIVTAACGNCGRPKESKPATLWGLCSDALVRGYRDARGMAIEVTGDEAGKRYGLAVKIVNEKIVELGVPDVKLIMDLVAKAYTPLVVAQIWDVLDPKEDE